MAEVGSAFVSILPSARGFGSKLQSEVGGDIDGAGKSMGSRFGSAFKVGALALMAGGFLAGKFLKGAIDDARESAVVTARTENVIKSMGLTSKVTAGQIGNLATAISNKTGVDDEAIQSGQNLLLTFKNVANDAGKAGGVFDQTSRLMVDLSAAMGTDAKGAAIQLGKALNDPVKGISALTRVGVSFSEKQKEQIANFVEAGDMAKAQGVILGELKNQFGGAAAAMATPADRLKVTLGNLKEQIGAGLIPVVDNLLNKVVLPGLGALSSAFDKGGIGGVVTMLGNQITAALPSLVDKLAGWGKAFVSWIETSGGPMLASLGGLLGKLVTWIAGALPTILSKVAAWATAFVEWIGPQVPGMLAKLGALLSTLGQWIGQTALPMLAAKLAAWAEALVAWIAPQIPGLLAKLGTLLMAVGQWISGTALPALLAKLLEWGKALVEWIGPQIPPMLSKLGELASRLFSWLLDVGLPRLLSNLKKWGEAFLKWIGPMIPPMLVEIGKLLGKLVLWLIGTGLPKLVGALVKLGIELVKWIGPMIPKAVAALAGLVGKLAGWVISTGLPMLADKLRAMAARAFEAFKDSAQKKSGEFLTLIKGIPGKVGDALAGLYEAGKHAAEELIRGLIGALGAGLQKVKDKVSEIAGAIKGFFPGSPVKEGPLTVWNDGHPGRYLMELLAKGIESGKFKVVNAALETAKALRDTFKSQLDQIKADFDSLSSTVAGAFTGNLFEATTGKDFLANLFDTRGQLEGLKKAFKKLLGWGVDPKFLSQLFSSGNGALILDLAAGKRGQALDSAAVFADVQSLSGQLGGNVAQAQYGKKLDRANDRLDKIERAIKQVGHDVANALNHTAANAARSA